MNYFLLLLPALAMAGLGAWLRRRSPAIGQALILLGCIGCLAVMGWQVRQSLFPPEARPPDRAKSVVGFFLSNQVMRDTVGKSGVVVLIFPPARVMNSDMAESYRNSLEPILLRGHPELRIESETLEVASQGREIPAAAFKAVLARHSAALAFISYASVPADMDQLFPQGQTPPPFYAFDSTRDGHWVQALKTKRVRSVIVPRPEINLAKTSELAGDPTELFARCFWMVTAENAEAIAAQLGKK
jgi:hypothetical protein